MSMNVTGRQNLGFGGVYKLQTSNPRVQNEVVKRYNEIRNEVEYSDHIDKVNLTKTQREIDVLEKTLAEKKLELEKQKAKNEVTKQKIAERKKTEPDLSLNEYSDGLKVVIAHKKDIGKKEAIDRDAAVLSRLTEGLLYDAGYLDDNIFEKGVDVRKSQTTPYEIPLRGKSLESMSQSAWEEGFKPVQEKQSDDID